MGLISAGDQERLREDFSKLTRPVRLLFFTQAVGCETCHITRQVLDELPLLSDNITIQELNLVLEGERPGSTASIGCPPSPWPTSTAKK